MTTVVSNVKVVIKCRPLNAQEIKDGRDRIVDMNLKTGKVDVYQAKPGEPAKTFRFDAVYNWESKQQDLYDETFRDLVQAVLEGFNGTIFAYGQTGSGKTFTMHGDKKHSELKGVIPNSFEQIFGHIARYENQEYQVRASYLEIYNEEIRDLLAEDQSKRLRLSERPDTGVYVNDLTDFVTKDIKEMEHVVNVGNKNRSEGVTNINEHCSRSHAIIAVSVECRENNGDGENQIHVGKLNLVDMAGSERRANAEGGERPKEGTMIKHPMSALGNVISALVDGKKSYIPYRDSQLTRLLQNSLGGNAKAVMVANIGPCDFHETISTLRFANRVKDVTNKPKINKKINENPKASYVS